jgi:hypothetical protein
MPTFTARLKSRSGGISDDGHRSYTVVYQVESDSLNVEPDAVEDAVGIAYYAPYPTDPAARLKRKSVSQEGSELYFHSVTLEYDTKPSPFDKGTAEAGGAATPSEPGTNSGATPPNLRPWVVKWGSVQTEVPLEKDRTVNDEYPTGKPVVNSAGQPFDPPVMVPSSNPTLTITAFRLLQRSDLILVFMDAVNAFPFFGWPPGHARCTSYSVTSQYEQGAFFWQVDVTVEFRKKAWNPIRVLDAGTVKKTGSELDGYKYRPCTDGLGQAVTSPVPLDGFGGQLAAGGTPVYLEFNGHDYADFSQLI